MKKLSTIGRFLLAALIVALPFQTRWIAIPGTLNGGPWEYGTVSLFAFDILIVLIVLIGAIVRRHDRRLSDSGLVALLLLVIAYFSMGEAVNRINALFWCAQLGKGVLLFFSIGWLQPRAVWIARAWVLSGVVQAALVHWQFALQRVWGNKWLGMAEQDPSTLGVTVIETAGERVLRAYGSLPHPNIAGIFLALALLCAVVLFTRTHGYRGKLLTGATVLLTSSALWLTYSRQAWIAAAVMLALLALHLFWQHRQFPFAALLVFLLALAPAIGWTAINPDLTLTRFAATERIEQQSFTDRDAHIQDAIPLIRNNWLAGVGIGNYTATVHRLDDSRESYAYQPVHNAYVLALAELGIAGFIALVLFAITLLWESHRGAHRPPLPYGRVHWHAVWSIAFIGLLAAAFFDHYLWSLPVGLTLFWLMAGITANRY
jgi:predicted membrane protein